ncbi:MAG: amidase family protein, partial [Burkholderiaceae bacterium]
MNLPQELAFRPAHELARLLRQREIGAVELLQLYLDRVQRLNPALNAVVVQTADTALQRAKAADTALTKGESWGPFHGLPMTVKESFNVPGLPTTWGHEAMKGNIATEPAVTVQRLQDAGAIV